MHWATRLIRSTLKLDYSWLNTMQMSLYLSAKEKMPLRKILTIMDMRMRFMKAQCMP